MKIPRELFTVWVGDAPFPPQAEEFLQRWRDLNPGWGLTVYRSDEGFPLVNKVLYDEFTHPGHRSDILRYEILCQIGGVYFDVDMEPLRPLEALLEDCACFYGTHEPTPIYEMNRVTSINTGILGCVPDHPLMADVVETLSVNPDRTNFLSLAGPLYFEDRVGAYKFVPGDRVVAFPPSVFHPYRWFEPHLAAGPFPDSYAVHRWWGTWAKKDSP